MKQLFAYIRVSTTRQGDGVSLQEQRAAIERYAERTNATIVEWFEERRTAAKGGRRPEFVRMVKLLRQRKAQGVVIHKIDRSTRNYRDWADIDDVLSEGADVFFANEDLDLRSRGGRLAADMQVVVAVDYIRNLRDETLKGIEGRLKQGILPGRAPIGYLDRGGGQPKALDPIRAPIIRQLFDRYAAGDVNLRELTNVAAALGLTATSGNPLRLQQMHTMLRNPFYAGILKSKRFGVFQGIHEPVVHLALFERVQRLLSGKAVRRTKSHFHLFRRLFHCKTCSRSLVASRVKNHVYYRCPTISCPTTSIREELITSAVLDILKTVTLNDEDIKQIEKELAISATDSRAAVESRRILLHEAQSIAKARLQRLTTLLLDAKIDEATHREAHASLVFERQRLADELSRTESAESTAIFAARQLLELARSPLRLFKHGDNEQKRRLLQIVMFNCTATSKTLEFSMREPFATFAKRSHQQLGTPDWNTDATSNLNPTLSAKEILGLATAIPDDIKAAIDELLASGDVQATADLRGAMSPDVPDIQ